MPLIPDKIDIGSKTVNVDAIKELLSTPIAKGFYGGAGLASLVSLLHANALDRKVDDIYKDDKTDKNTMVLRIPRRALGKRAATDVKLKVPSDKSGTRTKVVPPQLRGKRKPGQRPKVSGLHALERGEKRAALPRSMEEAMHVLAVMAAGVGGYKAVDHIYRKAVDRRLAKDEEAARREYLDALIPKQASAELEKEAISPLATLWLTALMLGGGSAYVAKDVLDARRDRLTDKSYAPPAVKRIVFKTDEDDEGAELTQDQFKAAFVIKMAEVSGLGEDFLTPELGESIKEAQIIPKEWQDNAWGAMQKGVGWLANAAPGLTNKIIMAGLKRFPQLLKMMPTQGGLTGDQVYKLYNGAQRAGGAPATFADNKVKSILEGPKGNAYRSQISGGAVGALRSGFDNTAAKVPGLSHLFTGKKEAGIATALLGSLAAEQMTDNNSRQQVPEPEGRSTREVQRLIRGLDIVGEDEDAEQYVEENRARIQAAIRTLMENKQI